MSAFMIWNILPYTTVMLGRVDASADTRAALTGLKETTKEESAMIALYQYDFTGIHYNLKDYGIKYDAVLYEQIDESYSRTYSDWIYYKIPQ